MLRSKFHSPWQPHISDGQLLNPSAHSSESMTSFSDQIEELEGPVRPPEASPPVSATASSGDAIGVLDASSSVAAEAPRPKARWYASWIGRFTRH